MTCFFTGCIHFHEYKGQRGRIVMRVPDDNPDSTTLAVGFATKFELRRKGYGAPTGITLSAGDPTRLEVVGMVDDTVTIRALRAGACDLVFSEGGNEIDRFTFDAADVPALGIDTPVRQVRAVAGAIIRVPGTETLRGEYFGESQTMVPVVEGRLAILDGGVIVMGEGTLSYPAGAATIDIDFQAAPITQMTSLTLVAGEPTHDFDSWHVPVTVKLADESGPWVGAACAWTLSNDNAIVFSAEEHTVEHDVATIAISPGRRSKVKCTIGALSHEIEVVAPSN